MHNKSKPLVTIGLPVYNGEKYVRRALDSLLAQDYEHFELIISDNASTDRTAEICREYVGKDRRIQYYRNASNMGAIWNFRRVLEMAQGEYFMWAAHDDQWEPAFMSSLARELETHPEAGVAMSAVERIQPDGTQYDIVRYENETDPANMKHLQIAVAIAARKPYHLFIYGLFRTDLLKKALDVPPVVAGDRLFMCQMAMATKFRYVDQILYIRQMSASSIRVRYANDELGKIWQNHHLGNWKKLLYIGPYLLSSKIIPVSRKLFILLIIYKFLFYPDFVGGLSEIYGLIYHLSGKLIGVERRDGLRKSIRQALGIKSTK